MRKIINGKLYNTETATLLGDTSKYLRSDFHHYEESLYLKRTGEFFLCGHGNAASKYHGITPDRLYSPGEGIIPLTHDEAQEWVEQNLSDSDYIEIFGAVSE